MKSSQHGCELVRYWLRRERIQLLNGGIEQRQIARASRRVVTYYAFPVISSAQVAWGSKLSERPSPGYSIGASQSGGNRRREAIGATDACFIHGRLVEKIGPLG